MMGGARPEGGAIERHPHLAAVRTPGIVRVDMHCHTMWSGDSTTTPGELATAVASTGIDVLCITDHSTIAGALALAERLPCRVVAGQEQRSAQGELIGLFVTDRLPPGLDAHALACAIREMGGLVYVPHPFDPARHHLAEPALAGLLAEGLVDVLEVLNAKTAFAKSLARARRLAEETGLAMGAGSDAHVPDAIGAAYVEMPDFSDATSFLAALAGGAVAGHHFDEPRPWSARIVPSTA